MLESLVPLSREDQVGLADGIGLGVHLLPVEVDRHLLTLFASDYRNCMIRLQYLHDFPERLRLLWKYVVCPGLHHGPPNLEHVGVQIGGLNSVSYANRTQRLARSTLYKDLYNRS